MDILVVDDSKTMRLILQRAIRQAGYRNLIVEEAENGLQALEKLKDASPKLILSDWNMPEMSGIELLQQMRALHMNVTLGFVTSEVADSSRELALNTGAAFLIQKPFTPVDIEDALRPILGTS